MSRLYHRGKVVVRPINRARTTTSPLPSCAHNLCTHNRRTTSRTTGDCEVEAGASRARHVQMLATSRGRRAPSARAPAPWASRDVRGAPAWPPSLVAAAHRSYRDWAERNGAVVLGRNTFGDQLEAHGFRRDTLSHGRTVAFAGLSLASAEPERWYEQ